MIWRRNSTERVKSFFQGLTVIKYQYNEKTPHMWRIFPSDIFDKQVLSKLYKETLIVAI